MTNYVFWDIQVLSIENAFLGAETLLPIFNLLTRRIWLEGFTTIAYALVCVASSFYLSPVSYS